MKFKTNFEKIKNTKIGNWLVLDEPHIIKNKTAHVACTCSCGIKKYVNYYTLMKGESTSCGCSNKSRDMFAPLRKWIAENGSPAKKSEGVASFNNLYNQYKHSAKVKNLEFFISKDFFGNITKQNCYYCGVEPHLKRNDGRMNGSYVYNGIDRKCNNKGYIEDNCLPCCAQCNYLKRDHNYEDFLKMIFTIGEHLANEKKRI